MVEQLIALVDHPRLSPIGPASRRLACARVKLPRRAARPSRYRRSTGCRIPCAVGIVRLVVPKYIVGAVTLVRDSEARSRAGCCCCASRPAAAGACPPACCRRGEPPVVGAARELAEESGVRLDPRGR